MATDYIAHVVYGVALEQVDADTITDLLAPLLDDEDLLTRLIDMDAISSNQDLENLLTYELDQNESFSGWLNKLCKKYKAPLLAELIYTGNEDDRPGRCATAPDCWILGIPLLTFPVDGIPAGKVDGILR